MRLKAGLHRIRHDKITIFLPNPATFCHFELSRIGVEFGCIRLFEIFVETGQIHANSMWNPRLTDELRSKLSDHAVHSRLGV